MSIEAVTAIPSRRAERANARHDEALRPARGIMIGFGLSAMIWSGIGALLLR